MMMIMTDIFIIQIWTSSLRGFDLQMCQKPQAGMAFWFDSIDCMQVLADAYSRPVCYHPDSGSKSQLDVALTYFPLVLPKRLDQKPVPLHL